MRFVTADRHRLSDGDPNRRQPVEGSDGLLIEIDGQIVPNYDATLVPFEEGDVVTGNVVRIDQDEVLVDIGYKSEGVILANELSIRKSVDPADEVELGEEVDALVLTKEDQDGRLLLSKKRARFEKAWRRIEAAAESGEPVEGTVIEVVKGGLIIDLGVRGFLPASLVDIRRVQNLDEFMSQKIECKVIELNRSRNNVVLSRRAVLEEERKEVRQQILDRLQPGQIVEGAISNIVDFGAFVDLDGIDGLIHISELSWSHVNHPSEILSIGDTVPVKVLDIDRDRQRISLGLKQTQEDPWQRVVDTYNLGDELEGKVTKVVTFGAFVEIMDGVEGLVHISELAHHHVENPREVVEPGQDVKVKILEIDSERRRLSLSVKRVAGNEPPPGTEGPAATPARAAAWRRRRVRRPRHRAVSATCGPPWTRRLLPRPTPRRRPRWRSRSGRGRGSGRGGSRPPRRQAPAEEAPAEEAPRRGGPPRRLAAERRARSRPRADEAEAEAARSRARDRRVRDVAHPVRRADRGHGLREVHGAGRARRAGRGHALVRRGRPRAAGHRRGARRGGRAPRRRGDRRRRVRWTAAPWRGKVFASDADREWLEELLWPRVRDRVAAVVRARCEDVPPPPWSRSRCCSRPGRRPPTTTPSPSWPTRTSAPSAPAGAATSGVEERHRPPAHAGREGGAGRLRRAQRRHPGGAARGSWPGTAAMAG